MVIIWIKDLNDVLSQVFLLNSLLIITTVKGVQVKGINRFSIPDTKCIYNVVAIAYNWQVIWNSLYRLITFLYEMAHTIAVFNTYIAAKFYFYSVLWTADLKWIAIFQPVIRNFYLITIFDLLFEHTITVTDTAAICRIAQGC